MIKIALYQPDIPQNVGAAIRLCACLGMDLDIIEPCGFVWDQKKIGKAALDYMDQTQLTRYSSWEKFSESSAGRRLVLMTTKSSAPYTQFDFQPGDILLAGRESSGVPGYVHESVQGRILIPMQKGLRSLNIVNATAMIAGEALRQTKAFAL